MTVRIGATSVAGQMNVRTNVIAGRKKVLSARTNVIVSRKKSAMV